MKRCSLCIIALTVEMCGANALAQPTLPLDSEQSSSEAAKASRAETDDESFVASKRKTWVEVWGYHSGQGHDSATNSLQGRLYHSFPIGRSGAQAVTRLDTSINSTSGPKYTGGGGGAFNPGNTRWTLVGYTPEVAQDLTFGGGFRLIMPTGYNNPPYSSAQWAMGPQLAMTYSPKNAGKFSYFSPTARYLMGMTAVSPKVALMRTLELYPSVGFQLTPQIKLAFWSEYGMSMNAQTGKWFVPADAMVTYSFSKTWAGSVGASAPIVKDNLLYFWNAYGRVVYNF